MTIDDGKEWFENAVKSVVTEGVDVVLDYLWGDSAVAIMSAIAKVSSEDITRFVSIGTSFGQENITIPSSILRSSNIELLGSGGKSVSKSEMLSGA